MQQNLCGMSQSRWDESMRSLMLPVKLCPCGPLLSGKMAPRNDPKWTFFSGISVKIPPGAAFGGAPGALRAPGRVFSADFR